MQLWKRFWNEEDGQDLVEYTLLLALSRWHPPRCLSPRGGNQPDLDHGRYEVEPSRPVRGKLVPAHPLWKEAGRCLGAPPSPESQAMKSQLQRLWRERGAQDLVEYTLLMAFLVLASAALYLNVSQTINALWTAISSRLAT